MAVTSAKAAEEARDFDPGKVLVLRFQLPVSGFIRLDKDGGAFTMFGASLAMRFAHLIELEGDMTAVVNPCANGGQLTARAGISPSLLTARAEGTHWNLRLPLLASGHFVDVTGDGCDGHMQDSRGVLDLAAGLDATHWSATGNGFNIRLLAGYGQWGLAEAALTLGVVLR